MRISVFGTGYVGVVSSGCLAGLGHEIIGVDIAAEKLALLAVGKSPIVEAELDGLIADAVKLGRLTTTQDLAAAVAGTDVSFISVGTPSAPDGSVALGAVDNVIKAIGAALRDSAKPHVVVMRSTVPPGTAEDRVIPLLEQASGRRLGDGLSDDSNPEFLREGAAVSDFRTPPFTLLGAPPGDDATLLRDLHAAIDAPAFAKAILRLLDDAALGAQRAGAARRRVEDRFSWSRAARQFEQICLRAMAAHAA